MPKEFINNALFGQSAEEVIETPDGPAETRHVLLDTSVVKVGWAKNKNYCEVAIVADLDDDTAESKARHTALDRKGINELIRTLRKARDQAFGADA